MAGKVVCLISRGLAPVRSVTDLAIGAVRQGWYLHLIQGRSASDAKNTAIGYAYAHGWSLLLAEDDVCFHEWDWPTEAHRDAVWVGETWCNNGTQRSVWRRQDGSVLYSGTPWVYIPADLVQRICKEAEQPVFQPRVCHTVGGRIMATGSIQANGGGSDVFFCWQLQQLGIPIKVLGQGYHILSDLSGNYYNVVTLRTLDPPPPWEFHGKQGAT